MPIRPENGGRVTELNDKKARELWALLQLRVALGDPTGELMHDELVERARDAWADAQLYRMRRARHGAKDRR